MNTLHNIPVSVVAPVVAPVVAKSTKTEKVALTVSLLETVRALDGSKADRYAVGLQALTRAYTQALQHGNKTDLNGMIASDGRKVCERAMRSAVQVVGIPSVSKLNAEAKQALIESSVMQALDIFASVACKESAPKQPRKDKNSPVTVIKPEAVAGTMPEDVETIETTSIDASELVAQTVLLIQAGALTADEIDALETALISCRMSTIPANTEMLSLSH